MKIVPVRVAAGACILAALGIAGCSSGDGLDYVSWAKAEEQARSEKKPILIVFGGPW